MKKANPDATPLFDQEHLEDDAQELARVVPIRTETTLTRYPFHRLSKHGDVVIKTTKKNDRGQVQSSWEVKDPPGPLAYKIDTLIINRCIDEMRMRGDLRQLFKIGSLKELCRELGLGGDTSTAKEALYQNAAAFIRAKISYKGNDGAERDFEFGTTRYTVIFTGEKLPNGKKADAVYVELHPRYFEMLKHSKTRPLDYKYLKELAPAPQRLYELLSFAMFGTLTHGRPNAQMLYSEFCQSAPVTRYYEYERVKKQMYKIHKPHIENDYIKSVEFQQTTNEEGEPDWLMKYTPGRRARHEYRAFTKKQEKLIEQKVAARPRLVAPALKQATQSQPKQNSEDQSTIEKLMGLGIGEDKATQLVTANRAECELWGDAWQYQNQKGMENPAAVLIRFIEKKHRPLPKGYSDAKKFEAKQKEQELESQRRFAEDCYFDFFAPQFREFQREEFARLQGENEEAFATFAKWLEKNHGRGLRMVTEEETREKITLQRAWEFFYSIQPELGVRLTSFEEWNEQHNTSNADPLEWFAQNPDVLNRFYQ